MENKLVSLNDIFGIGKNDLMNQYHSAPRGRGKIIQRGEKKNHELSVHSKVARELKKDYPDIMFRTDFAAGMKLSPAMATRHSNLQSCSGFPDLFIIEPKNGFYGLFIELKKEVLSQKDSIYKLDGSFKKSDHVENQKLVHKILRSKGFMVTFASGAENAMQIVKEYLR